MNPDADDVCRVKVSLRDAIRQPVTSRQ